MHWRLTEAQGFESTTLDRPRRISINDNFQSRSSVWRDDQGRVWLPGERDRAMRLTAAGIKSVKDTGYPRLIDRRGGVWFVRASTLPDGSEQRLILQTVDGQRATLRMPNLHAESFVREDSTGRIWVTTTRGLVRVAVQRGEKGPKLSMRTRYEGNLPKRPYNVFLHGRKLWLFAERPKGLGSRLYEVQLPSVE